MYHIYTTPAFVLKSYHQGDADAYVTLYTRDLGRVGASVRGLRKSTSKHRYALQPYSQVRVSIVRGKGGWRVTGSEDSVHLWKERKEVQPAIVRILGLVDRLVHGEEANEDLYDVLENGVHMMCENNLPSSAQEMAEIIVVGNVLTTLGYQPVLEKKFAGEDMNTERLIELSKNRNDIVRSINRALKASHL